MRDYTLRVDELASTLEIRDFRRRKVGPIPHRRLCASVESDSYQQFLEPTALLNDNSINSAALLLQSQLLGADIDSASTVAMFSTHDLVRARYRVPDEQLWRCTKMTRYWEKPIWILPIHRPEAHHWVLCVIYPREKELRLFDSFAEEKPWRAESQVCFLIAFPWLVVDNDHRSL